MKMTADESAAVALALAALRAQSAPEAADPRQSSSWWSKASPWVAAARLEALRDDV